MHDHTAEVSRLLDWHLHGAHIITSSWARKQSLEAPLSNLQRLHAWEAEIHSIPSYSPSNVVAQHNRINPLRWRRPYRPSLFIISVVLMALVISCLMANTSSTESTSIPRSACGAASHESYPHDRDLPCRPQRLASVCSGRSGFTANGFHAEEALEHARESQFHDC